MKVDSGSFPGSHFLYLKLNFKFKLSFKFEFIGNPICLHRKKGVCEEIIIFCFNIKMVIIGSEPKQIQQVLFWPFFDYINLQSPNNFLALKFWVLEPTHNFLINYCQRCTGVENLGV